MTIYLTHDALDSVPELSRHWDGPMEALLVTSGWLGHLGPGKLVLVHGIPGTEPTGPGEGSHMLLELQAGRDSE